MSNLTSTETTTEITSEESKWWQRDPTCAEAANDHRSAKIANTATERGHAHAAQAVMVRCDRLWQNGSTLYYAWFDRPPYTPSQQNQHKKVKETILEWEKYASIKFRLLDDPSEATIRISFRNEGSWSYVGRDVEQTPRDKPTMNLGWVYGDSDSISPDEYGVILHEFGHTLGLMHEHQSPDRGNKLHLKRDATIEYYQSLDRSWSVEDVTMQVLDVYNSQSVSNYSELDTASIMMYLMPAAMNEENIRIPPNNKLSKMDKAFMRINYPPRPTTDGEARNSFMAALLDAGVPSLAPDKTKVSEELTNFLTHYDKEDWNEIRFDFTEWCTAQRMVDKGRPKSASGVTDNLPAPGLAVFDGCGSDIDTPSGATLPSDDAQHGVAAPTSQLWIPGDVITYSYTQTTSPYRRNVVEFVMRDYEKRMNSNFKKWHLTLSILRS